MIITMKEDGFAAQFEHQQLTVNSDEAKGFRPYQLLASSVAGCSAIVFQRILDKMRLTYEDFHIEIDVTRNEEKVNRVERIHLHYKVKGEALTEKKIERALHLARENCPIVQSVQDSIAVTESFELVEA